MQLRPMQLPHETKSWRLSPWLWSEQEKLAFRARNPGAKVTPICIVDNRISAWTGGNIFAAPYAIGFEAISVHVTDFTPFPL